MTHSELYLNLSYNQKIILAVVVVGIVILIQILAKLKNKRKKVTKKKITHKYAKIDLCKYLTADMQQEFIGQKRMLINQLVRM